ncbi:hypothetical protein LZ198_17770 [Myxococcus sp. K15C18031901]|uniref:hypothetical protein n=1 Tax=Myxococcus dinghuensis TaxID=2906761 RepID=UPI0020A7BBBC|nr:hypothetical protein [Myxococcus dinghuensis]MCP3100721.1 hypothetical protein [Myxococcus dinghuensis]
MRQPTPSVTDALFHMDYYRGPPPGPERNIGFKEWQHFIVHTPRTQLIVNFSLMNEAWSTSAREPPVARVIILARRDTLEGDVDSFRGAQIDVQPGRIDTRLGTNSLRFERGRFLLSAALLERDLSVELELIPSSTPLATFGRPLAMGRSLSWVSVPRLRADGAITLNGRRERVTRAPAYHDHNWGHFAWGDDFAWEWGQFLAGSDADPWSLVFYRMIDRTRGRVRDQAILLWHGAELRRQFRGPDLRVTAHKRGGLPQALKVPRIMALLSPGTANDVPASLEVTAREGGDDLTARFELRSLAQVLIPDETDPTGVVTLNEACGQMTLSGRLRGEPLAMEGPCVLELVR